MAGQLDESADVEAIVRSSVSEAGDPAVPLEIVSVAFGLGVGTGVGYGVGTGLGIGVGTGTSIDVEYVAPICLDQASPDASGLPHKPVRGHGYAG